MNFDLLVKHLQHPKPNTRIASLHILNMVDEVRALDAISAAIPIEQDKRVHELMMQVGRRLNQLKKEGYDTIAELCKHFNVYSEVLSYADEAELKRVQRISSQSPDKADIKDKAINAAAMLITSQVMGVTAVMGMMPSSVSMSSNLGSVADDMQKFSKRLRAIRPTNEDYSVWIPRLKDPDPQQRRQALIELNNRGNPTALQYFASVHVGDSQDFVRENAKRLGKVMYWNSIYFQMEQDGSLDKLMQDYAAALGVSIPEKLSTQEIPIAQEQSIEDILKKAEERRNKRKR